eukprot:TRINITY_DN8055_c1_g2_i1.p1 TRINITY_DN8055_c1_g2~~TRINITY_DN8055_c1_g2_i1.p1  ORF type:complete len:825 (+),score=231.60 TRINITY_DN8055_c1_g2_i1:78-2477(+)
MATAPDDESEEFDGSDEETQEESEPPPEHFEDHVALVEENRRPCMCIPQSVYDLVAAVSVHSRVLLATVPVLIGVLAVSIVLLVDAADVLNGYDSTTHNYYSQLGKVVQRLELERRESLLLTRAMAAGSHVEDFTKERAHAIIVTDQAISDLLEFHFRSDGGVEDLVEHGEPRVRMLDPLLVALDKAKLEDTRNRVQQGLFEKGGQGVLDISRLYEDLITKLHVLGGRRLGKRFLKYPLQQASALSLIYFLDSWSSGFSVAELLQHPEVPRAALPELARVSAGSTRRRSDAEILFRSFQSLRVLERYDEISSTDTFQDFAYKIDYLAHATGFFTTPFDLGQVDIRFLTPEEIITTVLDPDETASGVGESGINAMVSDPATLEGRLQFLCTTAQRKVFDSVKELEAEARDRHTGRENKQIRRIIFLALTIMLSLLSVALLAINVYMYRASESQVRSANKEVQKLENSLQRMWEYVDAVEAFDLDSVDARSKGVPGAELSLYGSMPRIRELANFLPRPILSAAMREFDELQRPYTDFAVHTRNDVSILALNLDDLHAVSPTESDPVKQKTLETQLNKFLSSVEQNVDPLGGVLLHILADSVLVAWNLFGDCEEGATRACEAAVVMVHQAREIPVLRAGAGVATGDVLVGNVGTSTLVNFVVLGPSIPFSRHIQSLTAMYDLKIITCPRTEELALKGAFDTRPVDVVKLDMGGHGDRLQTLHEVVSPKPERGSEAEERLQMWRGMFRALLAGNTLEAQQELEKYIQGFEKTPSDFRFMELCDDYPNRVVGMNMLDILGMEGH